MPGVTRLDPAELDLKPDVQEGPALTRAAEQATFGTGLSAGVWSAEPHVEHIPSYPVDEVCVLLEGTLILRTPDGGAQTFRAGEAFSIARGTECTWDQPEKIRKVYVIRESPEG
jgi:uncharacterized protein